MNNRTSGELKVGLLGLGVVGSEVASHLFRYVDSIERKFGTRVEIKKILVRDLSKPRGETIPDSLITTNPEEVLRSPELDVIVEVMGGEQPAATYLSDALISGKHVITANKEVMAKFGPSLLELANRNKVRLLFEASVGGAIPIIGNLSSDLIANKVSSIRGIINGTSNYILTRMSEDHAEFGKALEEAQQQGYAETDPTNDIEGTDAVYKLSIMSALAFHTAVNPDDVYCEGITQLQTQDFRYADELGYAIKSLGIASLNGSSIQARVHPVLLPKGHMLAKVDGVYNAIEIAGDLCGQVLFHGRGAGKEPTASAVLGDLFEIMRTRNLSGLQNETPDNDLGLAIKSIDDLESKYYLRLNVSDQSGVLGQIAMILGEENISLAEVLQKDTNLLARTAEIVITTHPALEIALQRSLNRISKLGVVHEVSSLLRIED
ncbi:MAG: homoserine dehydrogenase [Chloroflexota bacterium]|nr:MAG: homoserine dehydrogenase [Chloroflexota bacterium]